MNKSSQNGSTDTFTYVRQFNTTSDVIGNRASNPSLRSIVGVPNSCPAPGEAAAHPPVILENSFPVSDERESACDAISVVKDTQSINSLSDDYCDRIVDEAFDAIDNFAFNESHVTSA